MRMPFEEHRERGHQAAADIRRPVPPAGADHQGGRMAAA